MSNTEEQYTSSSEINKTLEDRKDFIFLSFLFVYTSSITSYIYVCLMDQFFQQGLLPFELEPWNLLLIPQYLKILFCPFIDTFYIQKLGRRKTFFIILLSILTVYSFTLSFLYPQFINDQNVKTVRNLSFLQLLLTLILEIVAESWIIDYVYDDNYKFAAVIKYLMIFISTIFTIYLSYQPKLYFLLMSLYSIILVIYTYYNKIESDRYNSSMKLKSLCKRIGKFYTDLFEKDNQIKLIFIFISNFGLGYADNILERQPQQQQINNFMNLQYNLELILSVSLTLGIIVLILMKYKILPVYLIAQQIRSVNNFFLIVIFNYFSRKLQDILPIYKIIGESTKAIQAVLIYIVIYNSTKQKLSATMMVFFLLTFKIGQDANKLFSLYCYNSFGTPGDAIVGFIIQSFILIFAFEQRDAIFYKQ